MIEKLKSLIDGLLKNSLIEKIMPQKKKKRYRYLAYGSNLLRRRLEDRVGRVIRIGSAVLDDYELIFDCGNKWESFANIKPKQGSRVYGVTYLLTKRQIATLDRYEGLYYKKTVKVNGLDTIVYISNLRRKEFFVPPTRYYINLILKGYKENNLPIASNNLKTKIVKHYGVQ